MTVLVRDHVRLDECLVFDPELGLKVVEEAKVDVHLFVERAVERADLGAGETTARLHLVGEEDSVGVLVLPVAALKEAVPELLRAVDDGDDAAVLALVCILSRLTFRRDLAGRVTLADLLVVERRELAEPASAGKQREED